MTRRRIGIASRVAYKHACACGGILRAVVPGERVNAHGRIEAASIARHRVSPDRSVGVTRGVRQ